MTRISSISKKLVNPVGFSNGKAELTLKKPPPLVPSSLITSCEATGPWPRIWLPPVRVWITVAWLRFWITPWETRKRAPTIETGTRM